MSKPLDHGQLARLIGEATANGATRPTQARFMWDISADCENPYQRELYAAPPAEVQTDLDRLTATLAGIASNPPQVDTIVDLMRKHTPTGKTIVVKRGSKHPLILELWTRCRRCEKCRKARARMWRARALAECKSAPRTWFGTLTLNDEWQTIMLAKARQLMHSKGLDLEALDHGDQFRVRCGVISREITLFLKRVRKQSSSPLRYIVVAEQHKSGNPHFHALIHEVDKDIPVRYSVLSDQWKLGFTRWKLIDDPQQGAYLCKYLSKSAAARVRASIGYGEATASSPSVPPMGRSVF